MIDLKNRKILEDGTVICHVPAVIEMLYQAIDIDSVFVDDEEELAAYNASIKLLDSDLPLLIFANTQQYDGIDWYDNWLTPRQYLEQDVRALLLSRCSTAKERDRVEHEYRMFEERDMVPVLKHLLFLVDHLREQKIVWGVGRGSSVSSFLLYLIGINRINPLDFDLDVGEFLK